MAKENTSTDSNFAFNRVSRLKQNQQSDEESERFRPDMAEYLEQLRKITAIIAYIFEKASPADFSEHLEVLLNDFVLSCRRYEVSYPLMKYGQRMNAIRNIVCKYI